MHNSTEMIGDSMVKHIQGYKMSEATNGQEKIFVRAFHGAKVDDVNSYSVRTNEVAEEIVDLAKKGLCLRDYENSFCFFHRAT